MNDVIMSNADCTPGREPRSVAASLFEYVYFCWVRFSFFCTVPWDWL